MPSGSMKFAFIVSMVDRLSKPMQMAGKAVKTFSDAGANGLSRISTQAENNKAKFIAMVAPIQKIGKELQRFNKAFNFSGALENSVKTLKRASLGITAITGAITGVSLISQEAEKFEQLASSVGLSGKALSGWTGIISKGGFEADHVVDLVEEMNNKFGELASLGVMSSAEDSLKMLGLSFKEIRKLKPEEQFQKIMETASKMKDQQKAVSAVDMLFGGEANKILGLFRSEMKKTGKSVTQLIQEQQQYYLVSQKGAEGNRMLSEASKNLFGTAKSALSEFVGILGKYLAPILKDITQFVIQNMDAIRGYANKLGSMFKVFFSSLSNQTAVANAFTGLLKLFEKFTTSATTLKFAAIALVVAGIAPLIASIVQLTIVMLANPVGLIITAVVAAGVAIYAFRDELLALWNSIVDFFKNIGSVIAEKIKWLTGLLPDWLQEKLGFKASVSTQNTTTTKVDPAPSIKNSLDKKEKGKIEVEFKNAPKDMVLKEVKNEGRMALNANVGYSNSPIY